MRLTFKKFGILLAAVFATSLPGLAQAKHSAAPKEAEQTEDLTQKVTTYELVKESVSDLLNNGATLVFVNSTLGRPSVVLRKDKTIILCGLHTGDPQEGEKSTSECYRLN